MNEAPVARVLGALGAPNVDVRFVGGSVRNTVMNLPVTEIDIATPEVPARVMERLTAAGLKAVPTGIDHGTVMAVVDGHTFEITTLRRDTACDGRHAAVEFTTDWQEDARRRDFTFNAMSLAPDGRLFDDHGGLTDAEQGRVRFVGDAADRIQEDYLRILRLFRFFAWYGRAPLDAATLAACRAHVAGLARLSAERVQQELAKLLAAPNPTAAVMLMAEAGVLAQILPEAGDIAVLAALISHEHDAADLPADWLRRLATLVHHDDVVAVADRLKLSNAARARLGALTDPRSILDDGADLLDLRRALYRLGGALTADRVLLAWAQRGEPGDTGRWRALLEAARVWTPKTLPVTGDDVLAAGIPAGPDVGRLLAAVEEWWIGAGFAPSRDEALARLQRLITTP